MDQNSDLAAMHAFWIVQHSIAKLQERLSSATDLRLRNSLEALLKAEERKLAAMV